MKTFTKHALAAVLTIVVVSPLQAQGRGRSGGPPPPAGQGGARGRGGETTVQRTEVTRGGLVAPFGTYLFLPDVILRNQSQIGLTDAQRQFIMAEVQKAEQSAQNAQLQLAPETTKLESLLSAASINEQKVLAQADIILGLEREVKRAHIAMLIRVRNSLTEEQQARLRMVEPPAIDQ